MSADNYNMIVQRRDGKWVASSNHSMSKLMSEEEQESYKRAYNSLHADDQVYDTQAEAYAAMDDDYTEYGTFAHEYRDWFDESI